MEAGFTNSDTKVVQKFSIMTICRAFFLSFNVIEPEVNGG